MFQTELKSPVNAPKVTAVLVPATEDDEVAELRASASSFSWISACDGSGSSTTYSSPDSCTSETAFPSCPMRPDLNSKLTSVSAGISSSSKSSIILYYVFGCNSTKLHSNENSSSCGPHTLISSMSFFVMASVSGSSNAISILLSELTVILGIGPVTSTSQPFCVSSYPLSQSHFSPVKLA